MVIEFSVLGITLLALVVDSLRKADEGANYRPSDPAVRKFARATILLIGVWTVIIYYLIDKF